MKFDILPANMKTVTLRIRERGKYMSAAITLPPDLIKRNNLKDGMDIVVCYLCRADENPEKIEQIEQEQEDNE